MCKAKYHQAGVSQDILTRCIKRLFLFPRTLLCISGYSKINRIFLDTGVFGECFPRQDAFPGCLFLPISRSDPTQVGTTSTPHQMLRCMEERCRSQTSPKWRSICLRLTS